MKHKRISNSLDSFELFFEELEKKKVTKVKKVSVPFKQRLTEVKERGRKGLNTLKDHIERKLTTKKKLTKLQRAELVAQKKRAILGIWSLLVVVSIAYSTIVVREFVNTPASLVALVPQVAAAGWLLIKAFSKLYK